MSKIPPKIQIWYFQYTVLKLSILTICILTINTQIIIIWHIIYNWQNANCDSKIKQRFHTWYKLHTKFILIDFLPNVISLKVKFILSSFKFTVIFKCHIGHFAYLHFSAFILGEFKYSKVCYMGLESNKLLLVP